MYIAWQVWILADAVLIALIAMDEERKASFAREMGTAPQKRPAAAARADQSGGAEPEASISSLPPGHVMPWRKEKDEEQEIYRARGD
jgi:hypothetical protein